VAALTLVAATGAAGARQLASRPAPDWIARLERPDRVAGLKIDYIHLEARPEARSGRCGHRRGAGRDQPADGEGGRRIADW